MLFCCSCDHLEKVAKKFLQFFNLLGMWPFGFFMGNGSTIQQWLASATFLATKQRNNRAFLIKLFALLQPAPCRVIFTSRAAARSQVGFGQKKKRQLLLFGSLQLHYLPCFESKFYLQGLLAIFTCKLYLQILLVLNSIIQWELIFQYMGQNFKKVYPLA